MISFTDIQAYYVAFYPLVMSFIWIIGGLLFYFRWERIPRPQLKVFPQFSVIIAARNEEEHIESVIRCLAKLNYPNYEVVAVNDGSSDRTSEILERLSREFRGSLKVINLTPNSGKANAVNVGVLFSRGEFIMVMDADCFLEPNALRMMAWHFLNFPRVGAVTGNPRIINRTCLLGKIQVGEYSSIIGLIKRSQRILGKILTVSGVIAAYRRAAFYDCEYFDSDTATEDIDITWKLQKKMWSVRFEPRALCYILSPETIKGLWRQRVRWARGGIEVLMKHWGICLDWRQRRFWPIYLEYVASVLWALSLASLFLYTLFTHALNYFTGSIEVFSAPVWMGPVLVVVCMMQFVVSMFIDRRYESKPLIKYYFWIIWYPFFYWIVSALTIYAGISEALFKKEGGAAIWKSPDRGYHTLESLKNTD